MKKLNEALKYFSQSEIARFLGITRAYLSMFLNNRAPYLKKYDDKLDLVIEHGKNLQKIKKEFYKKLKKYK